MPMPETFQLSGSKSKWKDFITTFWNPIIDIFRRFQLHCWWLQVDCLSFFCHHSNLPQLDTTLHPVHAMHQTMSLPHNFWAPYNSDARQMTVPWCWCLLTLIAFIIFCIIFCNIRPTGQLFSKKFNTSQHVCCPAIHGDVPTMMPPHIASGSLLGCHLVLHIALPVAPPYFWMQG